jgi:transcriptional regulator with XRE-family HTH domain
MLRMEQKELAERAGISVETIKRLEGKRRRARREAEGEGANARIAAGAA